MTRYGITGSHQINPKQEAFVERVISTLVPEEGDEFTSGTAFGVDTIGILAAEALGFTILRLTIPTGAEYNIPLERYGQREDWLFERTERHPYTPDTCMKRNDLTIKHSDVLLAFPLSSGEVTRNMRNGLPPLSFFSRVGSVLMSPGAITMS